MTNLLLPAEAAKKLRVSRSKLYQMVREGKVLAYKVDKKTLFKEEELEKAILPAGKLVNRNPLGRKKKAPVVESVGVGETMSEVVQRDFPDGQPEPVQLVHDGGGDRPGADQAVQPDQL